MAKGRQVKPPQIQNPNIQAPPMPQAAPSFAPQAQGGGGIYHLLGLLGGGRGSPPVASMFRAFGGRNGQGGLPRASYGSPAVMAGPMGSRPVTNTPESVSRPSPRWTAQNAAACGPTG